MKDAGHRECVGSALRLELSDRTPVNNFALVTAARSAGITVDEARRNPGISAKISVDYAIKTCSDFVKPVLDSQIPFADLGMDVKFPVDDYGSVRGHLLEEPEDIDKLAFFDPYIPTECPKFTTVFVDALNETSKYLREDLHICGLSWGPITTAGYLMGTENMLMMTMMDPEMVTKLVKKVAPFVSSMQNRMIDSGATVMWMADPTSSEDIMSPDMFREHSYSALKDVISDVKKQQHVPSFLHICGNSLDTMKMLPEIGVDCFSFDHAVDIAAAKRNVGKKMALMGNIDPVRMIMNSNPDAITAECYKLIDIAGKDGGFILAPGCETPLTSPDENVIAMGKSGIDYWKNSAEEGI